MKKLLALTCMLSGYLFVGATIPQPTLPLDTESEHFKLYCMPHDKESAYKVLEVSEENWRKLSANLKHTYSTKINLYVFPSVQEFHYAINFPSAPEWAVISDDENTNSLFTVSPGNPGAVHSSESILQLNIVALANLFIKDMPANTKAPAWFCLGLGFWMADWKNKITLHKLASDHALVPSMQELNEFFWKHDSEKIHSNCAYSIIAYINQQWGWEKILALLADFSSFEQILGITQETLRTQWINYLDATYLN